MAQNKCYTFTFNSFDIRSLNNLPAGLLHRITCEMIRLLGGKYKCTEKLTPSSYDLQTAIEILYTEPPIIPRAIAFPETFSNFWGP
jgi:hypothetical protein